MINRLINKQEELSDIRKYLVKKGQSRYKGLVAFNKLKEAQILFNSSKELYVNLIGSQDREEVRLINCTYDKICYLFSEITQMCTNIRKMEFDLKTACGFIPILDGKEDTVKQLIDAVEMYSEMLSEGGQQLLIKFVLKDGLRSEKLSTIIAARNYSSLQDAIQAAKDESVPSSSAEVFMMTSTHRGRNNFSKYHRRGQSFQNFPENSYYNGRYSSHSTSKPPQSNFRGRFQNFRGNFNHYNKNVRYNHIKRNSYLVQNNNDQIQNSDRSGQKPPELDKKQFFRS
ncbi:uncharacterized protein LOC106707614 [Papilio machaon]|uniref:uncharacterized protein LOC106707614 n=1 Tax=Papilio machaon TaxID=76193 RepID=UPI001E665736|nr:uncharacterized protein LOC106707614 [Papilio machaon]